MHLRSTLLAASICLPLTACGGDGDDTTSDASTSNATPATTTDSTTMNPGTTVEPETTAPTTDTGTTTGSTSDSGATDPTTSTDPTTTDGTTDPGTTTDAETTTGVQGLGWAADAYPVLNPPVSCDCHNVGSGGLTMGDAATSYMNLVDVKSSQSMLDRVEPGDSSMSYFWHKINGTHVEAGGSGQKMPLGAAELPQATRDIIEQWITEGALP